MHHPLMRAEAAAHGRGEEVAVEDIGAAFLAQIFINAALHHAVQRLRACVGAFELLQ